MTYSQKLLFVIHREKSFFVYPDSVKPSPACFVALVTFTVFNSVSGVPSSSYSK